MIETAVRRRFLLSQWCEQHLHWCYALAFISLQVIVQFPIWHSSVPVLWDYPNHLARMHILLKAGHSADLNHFYELHWAVLPNLAMDMVVPPLAELVGLEVAGKLFLALLLLLIASGTLALHYVLHGRLSPWPFIVFLFLYNQAFIYGVVNYLFGVGVALWVIAAWIRSRSRAIWWRLAAFSFCTILLLFFHLSAFCVYAIVIVAYEVSHARHKVPGASRWTTLAVAIATLVVPVVIFLMFSPIGQGKGQEFNWIGLSFPMYLLFAFILKLCALRDLMRNYHLWWDFLTLITIGSLLIRWIFIRAIIIERSMVLPLTAIGIAFLLTPPNLYGSWMVDSRLLTAFVFVFIGSADLKLVKPFVQNLVLSLIACLLVVRIGVISYHWSEQDRMTAAYAKALDKLPSGKRLFTAFSRQKYSDELGSFKMYLPCLAIITRSAFVPSLYTLRGAQPVLLTPTYQALKSRTAGPLFPPGQSPDWSQVLRDYDYVLVEDQAKFPSLPTARLLAMASGPDFRLYQVRR